MAEEKAPYIPNKELGELDLVKCPKCENIHFRHTGHVMTFRAFGHHDKKKVDDSAIDHDTCEYIVYTCINCITPFVVIGDNLYDATEYINVNKFDIVSDALQAATQTPPHC